MHARLMLLVVGVLWSGAGCSSEPSPAQPAPQEEQAAAPLTEPTQEPPSPQVASLLPVDPDRVQWYRASRPGAPPRRVALFTAFDPQVQAPVLRSLGWSKGDGEVRLWPGPRAVWFWPHGLVQTAYRVWTPARSWDDGRGQRHGQERVQVPLGPIEAVRTERRGGSLRVLHWLAPQHGLVRLEVLRGQRRVLLLELCAEVKPERLGALPAASPADVWASLNAAVAHLDWRALDALVSPQLLRRLDGPRGAVEPLLGEPTGLPRLRAFLDLGLELEPREQAGAEPPPDLAQGVARLRATSRSGPVELVFRAQSKHWKWAAMEPLAGRE